MIYVCFRDQRYKNFHHELFFSRNVRESWISSYPALFSSCFAFISVFPYPRGNGVQQRGHHLCASAHPPAVLLLLINTCRGLGWGHSLASDCLLRHCLCVAVIWGMLTLAVSSHILATCSWLWGWERAKGSLYEILKESSSSSSTHWFAFYEICITNISS